MKYYYFLLWLFYTCSTYLSRRAFRTTIVRKHLLRRCRVISFAVVAESQSLLFFSSKLVLIRTRVWWDSSVLLSSIQRLFPFTARVSQCLVVKVLIKTFEFSKPSISRSAPLRWTRRMNRHFEKSGFHIAGQLSYNGIPMKGSRLIKTPCCIFCNFLCCLIDLELSTRSLFFSPQNIYNSCIVLHSPWYSWHKDCKRLLTYVMIFDYEIGK